MLAYFLKVNVAIVLFLCILSAVLLQRHVFRLAQNRTALLLCRFLSAVPLLNIQTWITEQDRWWPWQTSIARRCATGTHNRHRSGSYRLEKHPFRICQYRLLGNSGIADDTPHHATGGHHPPGMPMPQGTNRQHKYTSASQSRRAFLLFPLDFYPSVLAYGRGVQRNIDP